MVGNLEKLECFVLLITCLLWSEKIEAKKPKRQQEQALWIVECQMGMITDTDCPVDGGWATWGTWTPCRGTCDDTGLRQRARECTSPVPSKGGLTCAGPAEQEEICYLEHCTVNDFKALVTGDPARNACFNELEALPALTERCLQIECPYTAIEAALIADNTWKLQAETVWNALQCVKHNVGCPISGGWSVWGDWSACSARCGPGMRWRLRRCDSPQPSASNLLCDGEPLEGQKCEGDHCALDEVSKPDEEGKWSEWGAWSTCSEACGAGVRRRRRVCSERPNIKPRAAWGTHCRGQHDDIEICNNKVCLMEGGWSGWGGWSECSRSCGAGHRSRVRSCTRPVPTGGGASCEGSLTNSEPCHQAPCRSYMHTIAVMGGDSSLQYSSPTRRSSLFHLYVRFSPLSPFGTIVRRGTENGPLIRIGIRNWRVHVEVKDKGGSCALPPLYSNPLEAAQWHTLLITVTHDRATLKIDDAEPPILVRFPCEPILPDDDLTLRVGDKFVGQLQEIIVNFMPLSLRNEKQRKSGEVEIVPFSTANVAYENADTDEGYISIEGDQYIRVPCFDDQGDWKIEITLKPFREAGTILFMRDDRADNWLLVTLQNSRIKMKVAVGELHFEVSSAHNCIPNHWIDVVVTKKKASDTIEMVFNGGERQHIVLGSDLSSYRHRSLATIKIATMNEQKNIKHLKNHAKSTATTSEDDSGIEDDTPTGNVKTIHKDDVTFPICSDELFLGGVTTEIKKEIADATLTSLFGVIASFEINGASKDLMSYSQEYNKNGDLRLGSRAASLSGVYHETTWGKSKHLNLSCLHARSSRSMHAARWLHFDTAINGILDSTNTMKSHDDGRVLRLVATAGDRLRGFYTCRAHSNKLTRNVVTYGVVGGPKQHNACTEGTIIFSAVTALVLALSTLVMLLMEGFRDLRDGYGFFRDQNLTPEEEAEEIVRFIDLPQNKKLIGSKSAARLAKAKARKSAFQKSFDLMDFNVQHSKVVKKLTQQVLHPERKDMSNETESDDLPSLPVHKNTIVGKSKVPPQPIFNKDSVYNFSSPRHGSISTDIQVPEAVSTHSTSCQCLVHLTEPQNYHDSDRICYCNYIQDPIMLCDKYEPPETTSSSVKILHKNDSKKTLTVSDAFDLKTSEYRPGALIDTYEQQLTPGQRILQKFKQLKGSAAQISD